MAVLCEPRHISTEKEKKKKTVERQYRNCMNWAVCGCAVHVRCVLMFDITDEASPCEYASILMHTKNERKTGKSIKNQNYLIFNSKVCDDGHCAFYMHVEEHKNISNALWNWKIKSKRYSYRDMLWSVMYNRQCTQFRALMCRRTKVELIFNGRIWISLSLTI